MPVLFYYLHGNILIHQIHVPPMSHYPAIFIDGLSKTMTTLSQYSLIRDQDDSRAPELLLSHFRYFTAFIIIHYNHYYSRSLSPGVTCSHYLYSTCFHLCVVIRRTFLYVPELFL